MELLESIDLRAVFTAGCLLGALLAAYVMQASWQDRVLSCEPAWLRWGHRCASFWLATFLLWSFDYGHNRDWQPWPPIVGMVVVLNVSMALRIVTITLRRRRGGD